MLGIPNPKSHSMVADWVELTVVTERRLLAKRTVARCIAEATGDENREGEVSDEAFVGDVWRELERRSALYKPSLYKMDNSSVQPVRRSASRVDYITCLLLSLYGVQEQTSPRLFERLACHALGNYLPGQVELLGWPRRKGESGLAGCIRGLAQRMNERVVDPPRSAYKDRGVDVVGWIPFPEGRSGQVVVFLQCAAGHDWNKKRPVPLKAWGEYIHWACTPIAGFAVPCVIEEKTWHDYSNDKGMLFDRVRILNSLAAGFSDKRLSAALSDWAITQVDQMND